MADRLCRLFRIPAVILCVIFIAVYAAGITLSGGNIIEISEFLIVIAFAMILPGILIYKKSGISRQYENSIAIPLTYGVFYFCVITIIASLFQISIYIPYAVSIAILILMTGKNGMKDAAKHIPMCIADKRQRLFMTFIYCGAIFVFTFLCVAKHAHPEKVGQIILSQDFLWTVGNAESIKNGFPPTDIRFSGVTLKYHYLTELICAGVSEFTGISCYNVVGFYMQLFFMRFLIIALYECGRYFYGDEKKRNLFLVSFFALSCLSLWKVIPTGASVFGNSLLETLLSNVNSQATAFAFMSVFVMLMTGVMRGEKMNAVYFVTVIISFICLTFSKSPIAAIAILALVCAAFVNILTKQRNRNAVILSVCVAVIFAVIYFGYLSRGTSSSTTFSLTKTVELLYFRNYLNLIKLTKPSLYKFCVPVFIAATAFCIAPFQISVVIPRALRDIPRVFSLSFETLWAYACIAGGLLAFFVTYHEAYSQVYFLYTAIFFLNLLSVKLFTFDKLNIHNIVCYTFLVLSCFTTVCLYINFGGSGLRQYLYHYNIIEKYDYPYIVKSEDEEAAEYLRENMQDDELFITNRTHTGAGEGLSNVYTAFSGRQSYMEGFKYTMSNMGVSWDDVVKPRVELVGRVFGIYDEECADADEILSLCRRKNIRYAVMSSQFEGGNEALSEFETVYSSGTVTVYKIY